MITGKLTNNNNSAYITINNNAPDANGNFQLGGNYSITINNTNLVDGVANIQHNLNGNNIIVNVYDNANDYIQPDNIRIIDNNNISIDFSSFIPIVDNYRIIVLNIDGAQSISQNQSQNLPTNLDYSVVYNGEYTNLFKKNDENNFICEPLNDINNNVISNTNKINNDVLLKQESTSQVNLKIEYNLDGSQNIVLQPIDTSNLPQNFPTYTITGESINKANFYVCPDGSEDYGYLLILNYKGELLWYKDVGTYCTCFRKYVNKQGKNRYTYLKNINDEFPRGANFYFNTALIVLDENFNEIDKCYMVKYNNTNTNSPTENHDYIFYDDGHYVLINYYQNDGDAHWYNCIQEIKNRKLLWGISTEDYPELKTLSHTNQTTDFGHFNSIIDDYDNNYIISFRNVGLVKINKNTKEIMWVIGENRNDFSGIDTSLLPYQQHHIQIVYKDGSYTIFDNYGHDTKSRVLRYWLDENTMTAVAEEYICTYNKSQFMGSAKLVDFDNNVFDIAYGSAFNIAFEEYNFNTNTQIMKMVFDDSHDTYRIWRDI